MARREKGPISTMTGLLRAMTREYGSRKTGAILHRLRSTPLEIYVEEFFDDGKGHSGAFSSEDTPVTEEVFQQAIRERYIGGKLEPGYVSQWEFVITEFGQQTYYERRKIANDSLKFLASGEAMSFDTAYRMLSRIDSFSKEVVQDVLDWLISEGYLDSHEHVGQKFYLLGLRQKAA